MKTEGLLILKDGVVKANPGLQSVDLGTLDANEVLIKTEYSGINYKDALAVTGQGRILKSHPLIPGIDCAGVILESKSTNFKIGDPVVVTGCGIGELTHGGFAKHLKVNSQWVVPLKNKITTREAAIIGTAGFTAALALKLMIRNQQTKDKGPILITGASGGVGQFAVRLAALLGFDVIACSGKESSKARLLSIGASTVIKPEELKLGNRPLESVKFGGAIDNVGGQLLAQIISHTQLWGNVVSIGLAGGHEFTSTVMPHILRGVSLLGASSNNCDLSLRHEIWNDLATGWKISELNTYVSEEIDLNNAFDRSQKLLLRQISGRTLVKI